VPLGFPGTYIGTTDTGRTWTEYYSPDTSAVNDVMFADSTHGFFVGGRGLLLKYNASSVGIVDHRGAVPSAATLFQNYPNPFNPTTEIRYALAQRSQVLLRLYDGTGRELKALFRGTQEAGIHSVEFNGEGFSSGVYFYELTTNAGGSRTSQARKMLLLK
jgi:hypothetical protein